MSQVPCCLRLLAVVLTCSLATFGCDDKADPFGEPGDDLPDVVTYTHHVRSLLDNNCIRCHATSRQGADRNGAPVGVNFDTYADARSSADRADARIQAGTMPPTGGLSTHDRSLFHKWIEQGTQE